MRDADDPQFARSIAPFPVLDADGRPYDLPFLGGLEVPRPQFMDIDGDGDLDLFVQERSDELMFFENVGSATEPRYEWRTDRYADLSIGEWNRFIDLDGDGDLDLLAEQPFSYIRYYRNDGSPTAARWVLAADSIRDIEGAAVFSDRQNIPSIVDIDCDGRLDLFLGRVDGTITRYTEALGGDIPRFEFVTDRFQDIEIIGQVIGAPSMRHGANAMGFTDFDGDGDLDFLWGDYFEPGVLYVANTGGCTPVLRDAPRALPVAMDQPIATSGYNMTAPVDYDRDGDLDLFLGVLGGAFNPNRTAADNFWFLEGTPAGLELRSRRFLYGIDIGSESIPAFADIDGDGDLDLLLSNKIDPTRLAPPNQNSRLYIFTNTGSATAPAFALADTLDLAVSFHYAPAPADLDGDGDLDMLLGTWNDGVLYFRNDGSASSPRWVQDTTRTVTLPRGGNPTPALVDIDGDGDLDLFVGEASGEINFFRNTGSASDARFEIETEKYLDIDIGRRSFPAFSDYDGDGLADLFVGSEAGTLKLWRNRGSATEPRFEADSSFAVPLHFMSTPAFADLDGDGDDDLIAGANGGGLTYWERRR